MYSMWLYTFRFTKYRNNQILTFFGTFIQTHMFITIDITSCVCVTSEGYTVGYWIHTI